MTYSRKLIKASLFLSLLSTGCSAQSQSDAPSHEESILIAEHCIAVKTLKPGDKVKPFRDGTNRLFQLSNGDLRQELIWSKKGKPTGKFSADLEAEKQTVKSFEYDSMKRFGGRYIKIDADEANSYVLIKKGGEKEPAPEPLPANLYNPEAREFMFLSVENPKVGQVYRFDIVTVAPPYHAELSYIYDGPDSLNGNPVLKWRSANPDAKSSSIYWVSLDQPHMRRFELQDPSGMLWIHELCGD